MDVKKEIQIQQSDDLDDQIKKFKEEKNYSQCLILIEKNIVIKSEKHGRDSPEFLKTAKDLCELCNLIALSHLENNQDTEGLFYLLKAEKLFKNYKDLLSLCYNNIGCYYKLMGQYASSLQYLYKAIQIVYERNEKKKAAEIHLNASTILTNMGKYKLASEQCLACIILAQEFIVDTRESLSEEEIADNLTMLILSYQNLAVLNEMMHNPCQALLYFQLAENLSISKTSVKKDQKQILSDAHEFLDMRYKDKLISKIKIEKTENLDKLGIHFRKVYENKLAKNFENNLINTALIEIHKETLTTEENKRIIENEK